MGWVACQKVPVTATLPVTVVLARLTTHGDVPWFTVPITLVVSAASVAWTANVPAFVVAMVVLEKASVPDIGWVACQNVPLTGCVVCQNVPVTAMEFVTKAFTPI